MKALLLIFMISLVSCGTPGSKEKMSGDIDVPVIRTKVKASDTSLQVSKQVLAVLQDRAGNFWFGTEGDGVCLYDGKTFTYFTTKDGLCSDFVRTISEDKAGVIWFGTRDGICCYDGKRFFHASRRGYHSEPASLVKFENAVGQLPVDSDKVWKSSPDDLWFGATGGVYRYDGKSFSFLKLPGAGSTREHEINPHSVYSIFRDRAGNMWFGTETNGVCLYDGKSFTWFDAEGMKAGPVRAIFEDSKGNIWFGNSGSALFRYDGKSIINLADGKNPAYANFSNALNMRLDTLHCKEPNFSSIMTINEDNKGGIWIGSFEIGAWRFDGEKFTSFSAKEGLDSKSVMTIYKDNKGELWFGTYGKGVYKYDGTSFVNFTKKEAL